MLELFQKILKDKLTPNQLLLLFGIKNSISFPIENKETDAKKLIENLTWTTNGVEYSISLLAKKVVTEKVEEK